MLVRLIEIHFKNSLLYCALIYSVSVREKEFCLFYVWLCLWCSFWHYILPTCSDCMYTFLYIFLVNDYRWKSVNMLTSRWLDKTGKFHYGKDESLCTHLWQRPLLLFIFLPPMDKYLLPHALSFPRALCDTAQSDGKNTDFGEAGVLSHGDENEGVG